MDKIVVGIFSGSLRKESYSKKTAKFMATLLPDNFTAKLVEIGNLPMFNQDYDDEGKTPQEWTEFRKEVKALDGVLFVTPEYNRSLPAVLKNALDIASRPFGQNVWRGKPGAVISVSPGKVGAFGANHHLRQTAVCIDILMLQQPEAYIGDIAALLNAEGTITDDSVRKFLQNFSDAFASWVSRIADKK